MKTASIKPEQIFEKKQVLTLKMAQELIGQKIATTNREYEGNQPQAYEFTISKIATEWEIAATLSAQGKPGEPYENLQDYWASYMPAERIEELKHTMQIIDTDGERGHRCHPSGFYPEPTFTGSDADREVYYIIS